MWTFSLDRNSQQALHDQLAGQLRERIQSSYVPAGSRLPSSRELARSSGVGRNVVLAAYETLLVEGLVTSQVGRGTFVSDVEVERKATCAATSKAGPLNWDPLVARHPSASPLSPTSVAPPGAFRFDRLMPDPITYPVREIGRLFQETFRRHGAHALDYGAAAGYEPLREAIALRVSEQGGRARPENVLIVAGSQLGIDLVARLLLDRGDSVVVGAPTYSNVLPIWHLYGARATGVPLDEHGMRPDILRETLEHTRAKLLYVMPSFQNPSGLSMNEDRRREIVAIAGQFGVPVLEDHFDSELHYGARALPPLRAYDERAQVLLLGTFSKMLFPGLRLGWLVSPPEVHHRLLDIRRACEISPSLLPQMVAAELCSQGLLDKHLQKVRTELALRLEAMLEAAGRYLPADATWTQPQGGMSIWVTLPGGADAVQLLEQCQPKGVLFAPGPWFFADGSGARHLRLTFGSESAERISEGMRILGAAIKRHLRRRPDARRAPVETQPFL